MTTYADGIVMLKLNALVKHASGADKRGVVTGILERSSGTSYAVTWNDLTERWHAMDELSVVVEEDRQMRMPT